MIGSLTDLYARYEITEAERQTIEILSQEVYENTPCGVSVSLAEDGAAVLLSTIVEGSDAEWSFVLEFPFLETDWDGALEAAEAWSDTVRDELGPEEYTLTENETLLLIRALAAYGDTGQEAARADPVDAEHIELMLQNALSVTIVYDGPEGT